MRTHRQDQDHMSVFEAVLGPVFWSLVMVVVLVFSAVFYVLRLPLYAMQCHWAGRPFTWAEAFGVIPGPSSNETGVK